MDRNYRLDATLKTMMKFKNTTLVLPSGGIVQWTMNSGHVPKKVCELTEILPFVRLKPFVCYI